MAGALERQTVAFLAKEEQMPRNSLSRAITTSWFRSEYLEVVEKAQRERTSSLSCCEMNTLYCCEMNNIIIIILFLY